MERYYRPHPEGTRHRKEDLFLEGEYENTENGSR